MIRKVMAEPWLFFFLNIPLLSTIPNLLHAFSVHLMNCYFPDFWYSHVTEKRTSEGRNAICEKSRFRIISNFHLLPMSETVVATGHSGNSSFVNIRSLLSITSFFIIIFKFNTTDKKKQQVTFLCLRNKKVRTFFLEKLLIL